MCVLVGLVRVWRWQFLAASAGALFLVCLVSCLSLLFLPPMCSLGLFPLVLLVASSVVTPRCSRFSGRSTQIIACKLVSDTILHRDDELRLSVPGRWKQSSSLRLSKTAWWVGRASFAQLESPNLLQRVSGGTKMRPAMRLYIHEADTTNGCPFLPHRVHL